MADDGVFLKNWCRSAYRNQHNFGGGDGDRSRGVHGDAERAMVSGSFSLMEVRYLNRRKYRQEDKTQHSHDRQSA